MCVSRLWHAHAEKYQNGKWEIVRATTHCFNWLLLCFPCCQIQADCFAKERKNQCVFVQTRPKISSLSLKMVHTDSKKWQALDQNPWVQPSLSDWIGCCKFLYGFCLNNIPKNSDILYCQSDQTVCIRLGCLTSPPEYPWRDWILALKRLNSCAEFIHEETEFLRWAHSKTWSGRETRLETSCCICPDSNPSVTYSQ